MKISASPSSSRSHESGGSGRVGCSRHGARDVEQAAAGSRQRPGEQRRGPRIEVRIAREAHIERLELPCSLEQQQWSLAAAVLGERHLSAEQIHAGSAELVERSGLSCRPQAERGVEGAGLQVDLGRCKHALGAAARLRRKVGRPSEERCCGSEPAARLRATSGTLEFPRDVLVLALCGLRTMPGAAIRLELGVGRGRQRRVHALALEIRRRTIDRGAHQRMPESDLCADFQKSCPRCRLNGRARDSKLRRGAPHERGIADGLSRRD